MSFGTWRGRISTGQPDDPGELKHDVVVFVMLTATSGKHNVMVSSGVCLYVCTAGILTVTHQGAACDMTSVHVRLAALHIGTTLVFDRRTFPVSHSTCSWRVTTYVGKPSAMRLANSAFHRFEVDRLVVTWSICALPCLAWATPPGECLRSECRLAHSIRG